MAAPRTISLDAMGGDQGPAVVVPGAAIALDRHPDVSFLLFGDQARIAPHLEQAVRRGRSSSMWLALDAVQKHEADFMVSAGNTGALMAMAKLVLKTMPGIERPAIAALWPTLSSACIVLDLGANVGATARQLVDFALMGAAMAHAVLDIERPRVGLLNIGVEEIKGVEALTSSLFAKIGAMLAMRGLQGLKERMDPRRLNGGPFLGLNGIAIKSHGGTDAFGFASAIEVGYDMAESGVLERLAADLMALHGKLGRAEAARGTS
jgi:glycerol-3-phosphate acyltransferase PlsX